MNYAGDDANLIDPNRIAWLSDQGQRAYLAAAAVAADGTEHLVLAQLEALGDVSAPYDPHCAAVAHEQLGKLPAIWRHRTALAPLRCGHPTKAGRPCRTPISDPGTACARHRAEPTSWTTDRHATQ